MIKAIFWDNDGVLVDTEHLYFIANRDEMREHGLELSLETFKEISLKDGKSIFDVPEYKDFDENLVEEFREKRNERFSGLLREENSRLVLPGVRETLEKLKDKYLMGIVTSCRKEHFSIIHENSGLLEYFDFVLASGDYANSKPHPDPYLKALEKSGVKAEECVVVEDSPRGLASACSAGLKCVMIPNQLTKGSDFSTAFRVLENITELNSFL